MDKNRYIEECKDESLPHLPMGRLFYLLHSNGFQVKPDDYIEMLKVTERFGSADIDKTAKWICPIIATSETEQTRFYHIVEQYKKAESLLACAEPASRKVVPPYLRIVVICVAALLLVTAGFLLFRKRPLLLEETNKERTVEKGIPLLLDASGLLRDNLKDTAHIQFNWQFPDGPAIQGLRVSHIFKEAGDYLVKRQFYSAGIPLVKQADSLVVHVCNDLPKLHIKLPAEALMMKQPVTITAEVDANPGTVSYYQWTINDSVFTTKEPVVNNFIFYKEGDFPVDCKAVVGNAASACTVTDSQVIQVISNDLHYSTHFSMPAAGNYPVRSQLNWWVTAIFLLPATAGLLYSLFKKPGKKITAPAVSAPTQQINQGPFDIPFEQNDTKLVQSERDLRRVLTQMRYRAEEETLALNIQSTITSIIRSGGSPQLVFAPVKRQQQYLLLIDRTNPKSMLTHFFSYLAKSMEEDGIPVIVFFYDKNFRCFNDRYPSGLTLQILANLYSDATLIISGKAHELVYPVYPVLEEKFLLQLNRWQSKAIITPVPLIDWSVKEKVLQEYFVLLPADLPALQKLIPALREKIKINKHLLDITLPWQCSIKNTDFREITEIQNYLGNSEALFQWLCAICIYPRLKWEVLIEIGKTILDKYAEPENLNYTNLLCLSRISWMQQGVFSQATRLELLKLLTVENEIAAREKLLHMLNYSTVIYGASGSFFEEEKKRQVVTNQFILHAGNHDLYDQYAGSREAFKNLWKTDGLLDMPVKKYLEKTGSDSWQTPVNNGKDSVGLATYFNLHERTTSKSRQTKRWAAAASLLLIGAWAYIGYGGGAEKIAPFISVMRPRVSSIIPVSMKVLKNFRRCGDSLTSRFDQLEGYLEINNKRFALLYNEKTGTANFEIPGTYYLAGKGQLQLSWAINKSVVTRLNFTQKHLPDTVTIGCLDAAKIVKQPLYVRYNDTAGYRNLETDLTNALFRYAISAEQVDFSDSSRIVYYESNQKPRADSIVKTIKRRMNINVKEEFVQEIREPAATPILFLNTSAVYDTAGAANTNKGYDADFYHSMGDNFFMKKQYRKAIEQYKLAVGLNPKDALAFYQQGICYEMLGDAYTDKALEQYNAAIRINPNDISAYYRRASVQYELKKYPAAIADYTKVISQNAAIAKAQYLSSLYFRAKSKYFLNNLTGACDDFKKAADAGYAAGKKDYASYCGVPPKAGNDVSGYPANAAQQRETSLGSIEYDPKGYPNTAGLQLIEQLAGLLRKQPDGKLRLSASYASAEEQKNLQAYMNTIVNLFSKNGANAKTQIIQQITQSSLQVQQNAQAKRNITIQVTGINLDEPKQSKY